MNFSNKMEVLLDGGARHNVYYSPEIPEGAVEREVELAHGKSRVFEGRRYYLCG